MIEIYRFIEDHRSTYGVERMCRSLEISRNGYYTWKRGDKTKRQQANEALIVTIKAIDKEFHGTYGSPRMTRELRDRGICCNEKRIARLMKQADIKAAGARKFKVTTHSDHSLAVAENLVNQQFEADAPNQLWTSDITYLWTREGWLYLCVILDVFSRQIVGWSVDRYLKKELVIHALKQALARRHITPGLIFHSDRGSQYASNDFRKILDDYKILQSMSGKGNCYDNAITESFFSTLKRELIYPFETFRTRAEGKSTLFYYIEYFYNKIRKHSAIGYKAPIQYEKLKNAA